VTDVEDRPWAPDAAASRWADAFSGLAALVIVLMLAQYVGRHVAIALVRGGGQDVLDSYRDPLELTAALAVLALLVAGMCLYAGRARAAGVALLCSVVISFAGMAAAAFGVGSFSDLHNNAGIVVILSLTSAIASVAVAVVSGVALVVAPTGRRGIELWGATNLLAVGALWAASIGLRWWIQFERYPFDVRWELDVLLRILPVLAAVMILWPRVRTRTDPSPLLRVLLASWIATSVVPHLVTSSLLDEVFADGPVPTGVKAIVGALVLVDVVVLGAAMVVTLVLLARHDVPAPDDATADRSGSSVPPG
jgi:hypothetical protein